MGLPRDYDVDPDRYRLGMQVTGKYLDPAQTPLQERIWQLLPDRGEEIIADVGCADGALAAARPAGRRALLAGFD
ncbi:MAG: hypothetical protein WAL16_20740, partial [Streptosporangiaceae bacterium]